MSYINEIKKSNLTYDIQDKRIPEAAVADAGKIIAVDSTGAFVLGAAPSQLPPVVNDKYLHTNASTGNLEWSTVQSGGTDLPGSLPNRFLYAAANGGLQWATVSFPGSGTPIYKHTIVVNDTTNSTEATYICLSVDGTAVNDLMGFVGLLVGANPVTEQPTVKPLQIGFGGAVGAGVAYAGFGTTENDEICVIGQAPATVTVDSDQQNVVTPGELGVVQKIAMTDTVTVTDTVVPLVSGGGSTGPVLNFTQDQIKYITAYDVDGMDIETFSTLIHEGDEDEHTTGYQLTGRNIVFEYDNALWIGRFVGTATSENSISAIARPLSNASAYYDTVVQLEVDAETGEGVMIVTPDLTSPSTIPVQSLFHELVTYDFDTMDPEDFEAIVQENIGVLTGLSCGISYGGHYCIGRLDVNYGDGSFGVFFVNKDNTSEQYDGKVYLYEDPDTHEKSIRLKDVSLRANPLSFDVTNMSNYVALYPETIELDNYYTLFDYTPNDLSVYLENIDDGYGGAVGQYLGRVQSADKNEHTLNIGNIYNAENMSSAAFQDCLVSVEQDAETGDSYIHIHAEGVE